MRLVSTTLVGPGTLGMLPGALASVADWVDECIVIDTSPTPYPYLREVVDEAVGAKGTVAEWAWTGSFADARNAAFLTAERLGADWAVTVDTDERIQLGGEDVRGTLASFQGSGLLSLADDLSYAKPRFLRCRSGVRWLGSVHESIAVSAQADLHTLPLLRFSELWKTPEDLRRKYERDAAALRAELSTSPDSTRAWYYLGASLHGLEDVEGAIAAFRACARLDGWYEESAWACYRAAALLVSISRWDEALDMALAGLRRDAGIAELAWVAGVAALGMGEREQARCWAVLARAHSSGDALRRRLGFRDPLVLDGGVDRLLAAVAAT